MAGFPDVEPLSPLPSDEAQAMPTTTGANSVPQDNELDPILNTVQGLFHTDDSKAWGADIVQAIQQHVNMMRVSNANRDAAAQFVNNIDSTKQNLLAMVRDDPTSIDLAHTLAPLFLRGLVHNAIPENGDAVHADLTGHFTDEISKTAIQSMAEQDYGTANMMLQRYGSSLPAEDQDSLQGYINANQQARLMDHAAELKSRQSARDWQSGNAAVQYAQRLLNPGTENITFPPNYMSDLVQNTTIQPDDKLPLSRAFNRLQQFGDAPVSDPYTVSRLVNQIAQPSQANPGMHDIMDNVGIGKGLKYADAQMLSHMARVQTPQGENFTSALADVLNRGRTEIAPGDDRASAAAYSRFVNWLMPAVRQTGPAGLDPRSDNYLFKDMDLSGFAPRHEDVVAPANRTPLGQIFRASMSDTVGSGSMRPPTSAEGGDYYMGNIGRNTGPRPSVPGSADSMDRGESEKTNSDALKLPWGQDI